MYFKYRTFHNDYSPVYDDAEVNGAKVLVCGIDLQKTLNARPVARQMLSSLLRYMQSDHFRPQTKFTVDSLKLLFEK